MAQYCPVCDETSDAKICHRHNLPTIDESCFFRPHIPIEPGDTVDETFTVVKKLGEGSMGSVFEVRDTNGGQRALKIIKVRDDSSRQIIKRFYREAVAASRVRHPGIVSVEQFGVDERTGQPYQAMEYIQGETLDLFLERYPVRVETVTELFVQILEALAHLHDVGIVHRDLKPENIMVLTDGEHIQTKLLDFGIAKILEHEGDAPTLTATGVAVGTPHYMSPEQAKGLKVTPQADLYSLGCIIFEALTGNPPFDGGDFMSILISHVREQPPALPQESSWGERVPETIRHLIELSLRKAPEQRAPDARAMLRLLRGEKSDEITATNQAPKSTNWQMISIAIAVAVSALVLSLSI